MSICVKCSEEVLFEKVSVGEEVYHPECFECENCSKPLAGQQFIPKDGNCYCVECGKAMFGKKCAHCEEVILGPFLMALGQDFHPDHFVCYHCHLPFEGDLFFKKEDDTGVVRPYCEKDYNELFSVPCDGCGEQIAGEVFRALGKFWHPGCFICSICSSPFLGSDGEPVPYLEEDGIAYCQRDFLALKAAKCAACGESILEGNTVTVLDKTYHEDHVRCADCDTSLVTKLIFPAEDKLCCQDCSTARSLRPRNAAAAAGATTPPSDTTAAGAGGAAAGGGGNDDDDESDDEKHGKKFMVSASGRRQTDTRVSLYASKAVPVEPIVDEEDGDEEEEEAAAAAETAGVTACETADTPPAAPTAEEVAAADGSEAVLAPLRGGAAAAAAGPGSPGGSGLRKSPSARHKHRATSNRASFVFFPAPAETHFSVTDLQGVPAEELPSHIQPTEREKHLSDEAFEAVFQMTKEAFYSLPKWRQAEKKKKVMMF